MASIDLSFSFPNLSRLKYSDDDHLDFLFTLNCNAIVSFGLNSEGNIYVKGKTASASYYGYPIGDSDANELPSDDIRQDSGNNSSPIKFELKQGIGAPPKPTDLPADVKPFGLSWNFGQGSNIFGQEGYSTIGFYGGLSASTKSYFGYVMINGVWVNNTKFSYQGNLTLFTQSSDVVDFNNLTEDQANLIVYGNYPNSSYLYHGLGGSDSVTLPKAANFSKTITATDGSFLSLGWTASAKSTFYTDSKPGDTYTVLGSNGSYFVAGGLGNDNISITGDGNSDITAGTGQTTVSIKGAGTNHIHASTAINSPTSSNIPPSKFGEINLSGGTQTTIDGLYDAIKIDLGNGSELTNLGLVGLSSLSSEKRRSIIEQLSGQADSIFINKNTRDLDYLDLNSLSNNNSMTIENDGTIRFYCDLENIHLKNNMFKTVWLVSNHNTGNSLIDNAGLIRLASGFTASNSIINNLSSGTVFFGASSKATTCHINNSGLLQFDGTSETDNIYLDNQQSGIVKLGNPDNSVSLTSVGFYSIVGQGELTTELNVEKYQIEIHGRSNQAFSGNITRQVGLLVTGKWVFAGSLGSLTHSYNPNSAGPWKIDGGILQIGDGGVLGDIGKAGIQLINNGTLLINKSGGNADKLNITILQGDISGYGNFIQSNTGKTLISGAITLSGDTIIQGGTLEINNSQSVLSNIQFISGDQKPTLQIDFSSNLAGSLLTGLPWISGFNNGASIDLAFRPYNNSDVLTWSGSDSLLSIVAASSDKPTQLRLYGDHKVEEFTLSSDGHGGTLVTANGTLNSKAIITNLTQTVTPSQVVSLFVLGTDNNGNSQGYYSDSQNKTHGYLIKNGDFQTLDVPFAASSTTKIAAVTPEGLVWGSYQDGSKLNHGFVQYQSQFYQLDNPLGKLGTWLNAGNSTQVAGAFCDAVGLLHGYIETFSASGPQFTTLDDPLGVKGTWVTGLSSDGKATGFYINAAGDYRGFVYQAGKYTNTDVPSALSTIPVGINSNGQVVGTFQDTKGWHGFVYSNGSYTSNDYNKASLTAFTGINDYGDVVGVATVGTSTQSFATHIVG